jgi:DNA (cytosine-5)-methyltransferase 1
MSKRKHKVLSLFANIGVAEACLSEIGILVPVANEIVKRRADLYQKIYPDSIMICGDITTEDIYAEIINKSKKAGVDIILATPPCQGMSTVGQQEEDDERNSLILPVINAIKDLKPKYAVIENVPNFVNTSILLDGEWILLMDIIKKELEMNYSISVNIINTANYGVPQSRERMIVLLTRRDLKKEWLMPAKEDTIVTMNDAIGWIPSIDPFVKDLSPREFKKVFPLFEERKEKALFISKWNIPPVHIYRQVKVMQYTPTGKSAFDNAPEHRPIKDDGTLVKGYHNTYSRQRWDTPAYTVTMDNRKISSQGNVHPGRPMGKDKKGEDLYSDPRTLTLYELMRIMSIPDSWPLPADTNEAFVRRIIGEGIPPLFVKKLFNTIPE